jgi:hypothetical protein
MEMTMELVKLKGLNVMLWLHTEVDPPEKEWEPVMASLIERLKQSAPSDLRGFVISDGGTPNVNQRAQLDKLYRGRPVKASIVTTVLSNPIKRGIATALQWLNPSYAFFGPEGARAALQHVDLASETAAVWVAYRTMQSRLRPIKTLRLVANTLNLPPLA